MALLARFTDGRGNARFVLSRHDYRGPILIDKIRCPVYFSVRTKQGTFMPKPYDVELALRATGLPHRSLPFIYGMLTCSAITPDALVEPEFCALVFTIEEKQIPQRTDPAIYLRR
jgi:hypothetical protein